MDAKLATHTDDENDCNQVMKNLHQLCQHRPIFFASDAHQGNIEMHIGH